MFAPIHCVQQAGQQVYHQLQLTIPKQLLATTQAQRVKDVALVVFDRCSGFVKKFKGQSNEINIKPIAMISCLSLIAILIISVFRHYAICPLPPKAHKP